MEQIAITEQHTKAVQLHQSILTHAQIAAASIVEIGKCLRTMQIEKLYTELGYKSFEDYAEQALNLKRSQAYKYIRVIDNLGEEFVHSNAQLGISKLALIASVDIKEDREQMIEKNDIGNMSAKEIQELVEKNKKQEEQLSFLSQELETTKASVGTESSLSVIAAEAMKSEIQKLKDELAKKEQEYTEEWECADRLGAEKEELEEKLQMARKELEVLKKQPIDIAVSEPDYEEMERIRAEAEKKAAKAYTQEQERLKKEHEREIEYICADFEKKLEQAKSEVPKPIATKDTKDTFKAYFAHVYDSFNRLIDFIKSVPDNTIYIEKIKNLIEALNESIEQLNSENEGLK